MRDQIKTFVGLGVHKDSTAIAYAEAGGPGAEIFGNHRSQCHFSHQGVGYAG